MSSYTKLNPSLTKRAIIICSLIAGVIIIGTVVTITTRNKSQEINSYQKYEFKVKSIEPRWVKFVDKDKSLVNAFVAAINVKSEPVYACRVNLTMDIVPGTYNSELKSCLVGYDFHPHIYSEFEVLIAEDPSIFIWRDKVLASNGALIAGISEYTNEYKIARVKHSDGDLAIGSLKTDEGKAHIPWNKYVLIYNDYEVLCLNDYSLV